MIQHQNQHQHHVNNDSHHQQSKHSIQQINQHQQNTICIEWGAIYRDNKFYLSDKFSIEKLQELEKQIKKQKDRIDQPLINQKEESQSFMSMRQVNDKESSMRSQAIKVNVLNNRKKKAQNQLLEEQNRYREKIRDLRNKLHPKQNGKMNNLKSSHIPNSNKEEVVEKEGLPQSNDKNKHSKQQQMTHQQPIHQDKSLNAKQSSHSKPIQQSKKQQHLKIDQKGQNKSKISKQSVKSKVSQRDKIINKLTGKMGSQSKKEIQNSNKKSFKINQETLKQQKDKSVTNSKKTSIKNQQKKSEKKQQFNKIQTNIKLQEKQYVKNQISSKNKQDEDHFVNRSVQWSQRTEFVVKENNQKLNNLLNQFDPNLKPNVQYSLSKKSKISEFKKKSVTISLKKDLQKNDDNLLESNVEYKNQSINSVKKSNKQFLIHYPKSQSISKKSSANNQTSEQRYSSVHQQKQQQMINDHNSRSRAKHTSSSLVNEQILRKGYPQNQAEIVSKSQIINLKKQMQQLKKQLNYILDNQPTFSNNPSVNQQKLLTESRRDSSQRIFHSPTKIQTKALPKINYNMKKNFILESSIVQYNFLEEKRKSQLIDNQKMQKQKLTEEIERLKKIIRQLRLEKIKQSESYNSIGVLQIDRPQVSLAEQKGHTSRMVQKMKQPQVKTISQFENSKFNDSKNFNFGKIIKNSPEKTIEAERRSIILNTATKFNKKQSVIQTKSQNKYTIDNKDSLNDPLPHRKKIQQNIFQTPKSRQHVIDKLNFNQSQFNKFVEQTQSQTELINAQFRSRHINKKPSNPQYVNHQQKININKIPNNSSPKNNIITSIIPKNSRPPKDEISITSQNNNKKINPPHSTHFEIFQEPYEQPKQIKPIVFDTNNLQVPDLPPTPDNTMNQQQLIKLAKQTFKRLLNIQFDEQNDSLDKDNSLSVRKYKNCILCSTSMTNQVILWDFNGKFYLGGWKKTGNGEGEKSGEGLQYLPGKYIYKGQFLKGKKNGNGYIKMDNGDIYEGQWTDGMKNGRGKFLQHKTGVSYQGQWKQNKKDGKGILRFSSNQYYEGTFTKSMKHGFGVQFFSNGDSYKGQYNLGKFHGRGRYDWANGSSYQGNFNQGLRSGQGKWRSARQGGDMYVGQYLKDKKNGYGRYVWSNGCVYQGNFQNDLKNGKGRLSYQDGKEVKGKWENGNLVQTENGKKPFQNEQQPLRKSIRYSSFMIEQNSRCYEDHHKKSNYQ